MLMLILCLVSAFDFQEIGGGSSALQISTAINSSYSATAVNPALLPDLVKNSIGIVYSCPFNISQIQYSRISANYKNYGVNISHLGQTGYQEYTVSASVGFNLNPNLSYGFILKGLYLDLSDYGQSFMPALNFGLVYKIDKFIFGSVIDNINNPSIADGDDIPLTIRIGTTFIPVKDFLLGAEITKTTQDENLAFGAELKPLPILTVCLGTSVNPLIISGGIGLNYKNIYFDYALKYHTKLRDTSIISFGYCF